MTPDKAYTQIRKFVGRAIAEFDMIRDGDRILVGVSGGLDSMILMHVLHDLRRRAPIDFSLIGLTVDMGFKKFNLPALVDYCHTQNWTYETLTFPGKELMSDKDMGNRPCSFCSRMRRGQIYKAADRFGCRKVALGQQLDDLCVSFLMSLFRGNGLKTMGPNVPADNFSKRVIRPLTLVPKSWIRIAAEKFCFPRSGECDYTRALEEHGDRAYLERLIQNLDQDQFDHIRQCMLRSMSNLEENHLLDPRFLPLEDVRG